MNRSSRSSTPRRSACAAALLLTSLAALGGAAAQEPPIQETPIQETPIEETPAARTRLPLLREGSRLVEADGTVTRGALPGLWIFEPDAEAPGLPRHRLAILPTIHLDELVQIVAATERATPRFRVTGVVTLFQDRNWLLMTHPPLLLDEPAPRPAPSEPPVPGEDDSIRSIIEALESEAGPVARRPETPTAIRSDLLPDGTRLARRRGHVMRTEGGAYRFVFAADESGRSDPPMLLLPCLLLEEIDAQLRRREGVRPTIVITGRVTTSGGRNYLLPTVFVVPRERTLLTPGPTARVREPRSPASARP